MCYPFISKKWAGKKVNMTPDHFMSSNQQLKRTAKLFKKQ